MLIMVMDKDQKCVLCGNSLTFTYKGMREWNISGNLCGNCYGKKLTDYYISSKVKNVAKS